MNLRRTTLPMDIPALARRLSALEQMMGPLAVRSSEEARAAAGVKGQRHPAAKRWRPLTGDEIRGLEAEGNRSPDWNQILVSPGFQPERILDSELIGPLRLGVFRGVIRTPGGMARPTGIYHSAVIKSEIGDARIDGVSRLENVRVENGASLLNCGFVGGTPAHFSLGDRIHPGGETGYRSVWLWPGMSMDWCAWALSLPLSEQEKVEKIFAAFRRRVTYSLAWIGPGARIWNVPRVEGAAVGAGVVLDGATRVGNSFLGTGARVCDGAVVEGSVIGGGVVIDGARVERSALLEGAGASRSALVKESVLGAGTSVSRGEVIASLVGPGTGFHHEALLISALWPEGRGNVGYGAMVGSNHTGRMPDQEVRPGEGAFFGLGCCVKFPCNFEAAPYTLVAAGLTLLPQRLACPFSLISAPATPGEKTPPGYNEILPGWLWDKNPFALFRSLFKHRARGELGYTFFTPRIARQVLAAAQALEKSGELRMFLTDRDVPELGKNVCTQENACAGVAAWRDWMWFCLAAARMEKRVTGKGLEREMLRFLGASSVPVLLRGDEGRIGALQRRLRQSAERDGKRGVQVFDDYAKFHPGPEEMAVRDATLKSAFAWLRRLA